MTRHKPELARVSLLSPPYADLTYSLPEYLAGCSFHLGQRVLVPLGKSLRAGIIRAFEPDTGNSEGEYKLKSILWPLEKEALLPASYIDLVQQMANRQTENFGRIMGTILPAGLRSGKARMRFFSGLKPVELQPKDLHAMPTEGLIELGRLWQQGKAEVLRPGLSPLDAELCCLAHDPPWPVRPAAKAQTAMLEYLLESGAVTRRKLGEAMGKGAAATLSVLSPQED